MIKKLCFTLMLLFIASTLSSQEVTEVLSWSNYINIVKKNHPVTVQAKLLGDIAKARKKQAWGGFDPKIDAEFDRKFYDGTEYFSFLTPEVKLPLWYGIELKGSYTQAEGAYLNPQNKVPSQGLSYGGIGFQIGKGLLMDKRRATFRQAQIFQQSTQNEQIMLLNDIFQDAGESYINWQNKFYIAEVFENAFNLANVRFEAVKINFAGGDSPAIDTVEALMNLQQREIQLQQARLELQQAKYELSTFLWLENNTPVDPDKLNIKPQDQLEIPLNPQIEILNNPKLLSYNFKIRDLNIERRLKVEDLKPELGVSLGLLNQGTSVLRNLNSNYWENNNKVNVRFAFPLTFSAARGNLAETKIKIRQTEIERDLIQNDLQNKLNQNFAEQSVLQTQLRLLKQSYTAGEKLLQGEEMRFNMGESSLFLVNSRETKLIEVNEKLLNIDAKIKKAQLKALWLNGTLFENLESPD